MPDDLVGTVMSDLSGRRGRVLGTEPVGDDRTLVRAEVPQIEIIRYAIDLRAFSHGAATFTRKFVRYEPMPDNLAARKLWLTGPGAASAPGRRGCSARAAGARRRCASQCSTSSSYAGLAHQLDELARVGDVDRLHAPMCASVLPEQYQSRSWPPGPQPRRSYSPIETSVYDVPSGRSTSR